MTTASKITLVRVVLIPVYMVLMLLSANGADWPVSYTHLTLPTNSRV